MSKTQVVEYRGVGFWAYDVAGGIFLKHLIDCAHRHVGQEGTKWLSDCVDQWRINAVLSDFGLHLDEKWSQSQLDVVLSLIDKACGTLEERETISAQEMKAWSILDGEGVFARGTAHFPTAPVVELGRAIQFLLRGTLPAPPEGTWWFYGVETGRTTLEMGSSH